ncbi:single strand DNA binding protein [Pseudomonas phage vB_PaeS_PA16b]|nr:single strand DNA binding protein [Pseudomonas phage vB_PA16b]
MQLIQAFNAQQYDPTQGVGSLPIGKHPVIVESSEVKANKANDGGYLQLNLRIIDGPQQGTTGAYRLNLYHSNQQTVEIAHRQLSAICHVIGVFQVTDSSQLHNLPFLIEVGPQKNDPQYTEVKKVFDMNGNEPGKAGAGAPAAQPQQQQPQGGAGFGQQPQQPQGQNGGAWGGQPQQQPAQQPAQQPQGAAWGGQPAQQPAQQQPAQGGGWQQGGQPAQGGAPAGAAPWGQR